MVSKKNDREENIGLRYRKSDFSKWYNEIIAKSELADLRYNAKGFLVHRPWSVMAMKEMYRLYEAELERNGHLPVWFPALIPESNFKKEADHIEGFAPELFWITRTGDKALTDRLALRPTSETAMYNMYSKWVRSWRDLPLKLYQSCQVWRCDTKATRPFIRGREFFWIEAHDVFGTRKGAEDQVKEDMKTTEQVMHKEFGIPFMFVQRPEWDKFPGAVHTYAADTIMPDGKVLQQPSTHLLGHNFAKSFNIKYRDKKGNEKLGWQTCYGPAIWRMMASVIAQHGDDKGLIFPFKIAPAQVIVVPIGKSSAVKKKCKDVRDGLVEACIRTIIDDSDKRPGWKFNQWEMRGVPIRIEIGPEEAKTGKLTLVRRDTAKKDKISEKCLVKMIEKLGNDITKSLVKRADKFFNENIRTAKSMEELGVLLKLGGMIRANFCSVESNGEPCADEIQDKYHAMIRGTRADKKEKPTGKCIVCGKRANYVVYVGKQY